MLFTVIGAHCD